MKLLKDIKENPVVESVLLAPIKAIPVLGDLIDSSTNKLLNDFQQKKEQELLDVILQDDHSITSEMVNDVEFIINFAWAKEAVQRLATTDKVEYFGNLIRNGYLQGKHIDGSIFDEYIHILNNCASHSRYFQWYLNEKLNSSCGLSLSNYAGLNSVMHLNNSIFLSYNKPVSTHDLCFYAY